MTLNSTDARPDTQNSVATDLVRLARADPHRPQFHFLPPAGWLNDPNGVSQRDGVYHLFYQYNPDAPVHHRIQWGHATSLDLITWTHQPIALIPDDDGPDMDGCWSGVLVDDDGAPALLYSGRNAANTFEVGCLATGSDDLQTWSKYAQNPVVTAPADLDLVAFRDHCVWREDGTWRQLVGAGIRDVGGTALLFESDDLRQWRYIGPLAIGDLRGADGLGGKPGTATWTGAMWECIDLFRVNADGTSSAPGAPDQPAGSDVLVFSAWDDDTFHTLYYTGRYNADTFTPESLHRLDLGERAFYAPQSFTDNAGRRIVFGWIQEERPESESIAAGWSGVMSLPRVATWHAGAVDFTPAPEVAALRTEHISVVNECSPVELAPAVRLDGPSGQQLDLEIDLRLPPGVEADLTVLCSETERTVIRVGRTGIDVGHLTLDRAAGSLNPAVRSSGRDGTFPMGIDDLVRLRVLIDHSVLEIFANGQPLTARIYPNRPEEAIHTSISAASTSGPDSSVVVERFEAWRMRSIWSPAM
jgi:beta-fructofuranosidase